MNNALSNESKHKFLHQILTKMIAAAHLETRVFRRSNFLIQHITVSILIKTLVYKGSYKRKNTLYSVKKSYFLY